MLSWKYQKPSFSLSVAGCALWLCLGIAPSAIAQEEPMAPDEEPAVQAEEPADQEEVSEQMDPDQLDSDEEGDAEGAEGEAPQEGGEAAEEEGAGLAEAAEPSGVDDEERAHQLKQYQEAYEHYAAQMEDYKATIDSIVEAEYNRRVAEVNEAYQGEINSLEAVEQERRENAIAAFEEYLRRYPNEPGYTPDALFRLAELHFEKANADYLQADESYQEEMLAYEAGELADPPRLPERDFTATAQLFQRLIDDWPEYEQIDGALYLLAYCKLQMHEEEESRDLLAQLVEEHPDSEFTPEAWVRIGEYWFSYADNAEELDHARYAYEQAMAFEDSDFYDKALYKLAWTYYRQDSFDRAIREFKNLVEYSDAEKERTGRSGSVLRAEAVQYIAVSLAEQDWDLDGVVDPEFGLPRVRQYLSGDLPYEREVLVELIEYMFDNTRFDIAEDIIRYTLERYPRDAENPLLHEKLVLALTRDGRDDEAFAERGALLDHYGPDSDWYAYQKRVGREEALRYANNLVRDNLIQSATWFHEQAQHIRNEALVRQDAEMLERAQGAYARAASAYADFLARYPNDKDVYQWNFYYAESLYYSGQYEPAFEQYKVVRELDLSDNMYQERAAFNAIKALEFNLQEQVERGEMVSKVLPGEATDDAREAAEQQAAQQPDPEDSDGQIVRFEPEPIPDTVMRYLTAMDRYVVLGLENDSDPELDVKFAFQGGKLFYDFKDYDTARERFTWIVDNYPENELAYLSGSLILETYRQEQDYQSLAMWADKLSDVIKGDQAEAIQEEVQQFKLGAMFKTAEQLFAAEKYDEAAEEYLRLVNNSPDHPYAAKALNNAAVAYENVSKYESAMNLYERVYQDYPSSDLSGYALYRVAVNSDRFFDFDKAVQSYLLFYEKFEGQNPEELQAMGFDISERRQTALRSAAVLTENQQRYADAAGLYEQYVRAYPAASDTSSVQWQAVKNWQRADNFNRMSDAVANYRRHYGSDPANSERVLEGMTLIADHYADQNDKRQALSWYRDIMNEYSSRGLERGGPGAYYGAKARFMLAEEDFQKWDEIAIKGNMTQQGKLLEKKVEDQQQVARAFQEVFEYGSVEWTLAAYYRTGSLYEAFAEALYDVPIPYEEGSEEWEIYRGQLDDMVVPLEDKAVEFYEDTIKRARDEKVVNEWTKRTLEALNNYLPDQYPLYKEEQTEVARRGRTGGSFMGVEAYQESLETPTGPMDDEDEQVIDEDSGEEP